MRVFLCGVRGSTPSPGPAFVRYGGNTSCVALSRDGGPPTLVLDAGTGLQRLSGLMDGRPFRGSILLSHLHWDHTHGLPFFAAGDRPDAEVTLLMPAQGDPVNVLARAMSPPHFPIKPSELRGKWRFLGIQEGPRSIEGFEMVAREIPHKGGLTYGYRITADGATLAYLSDHSPIVLGQGPGGVGVYHPAALDLARSVDLLIHDGQLLKAQFAEWAPFGHSAVEYAIGLAEVAGAKKLLLFHHDLARTDDEIDAIVAAHQGGRVPVEAAVEGTTLDLP